MTEGERLGAIFDRLGKIDRDLAQHSAHMSGELARVGDRLEGLDERIRTQNGRVTRAEHRLNELETQARIASVQATAEEKSSAFWMDKGVGVVIGAFLVVLAGLLGHFL